MPRDVNISREETNRLEQEAQRLEEELQLVRNMREGRSQAEAAAAVSAAASAPRWRSAAVLPEEEAEEERWRSASILIEGEEEDEEETAGNVRRASQPARFSSLPPASRHDRVVHEDAPVFRWRGAAELDDNSSTSLHRPGSSSSACESPIGAQAEKAYVRKAGEFGSLEVFLKDLGLRNFAPVFQEHGYDTPESVAALDPRRLRALGLDHNQERKLRVGIAELRACGTIPVVPPRPAPAGKAACSAARSSRESAAAHASVCGKAPGKPPAAARNSSQQRATSADGRSTNSKFGGGSRPLSGSELTPEPPPRVCAREPSCDSKPAAMRAFSGGIPRARAPSQGLPRPGAILKRSPSAGARRLRP